MSKNRKICDIYLKNNRLAIDLNLKLMHNTSIETQKRGETAMQIKITVDIENTDILKFFELFKKDLATVAKIILLIIPWNKNLTLMRLQLTLKLKL